MYINMLMYVNSRNPIDLFKSRFSRFRRMFDSIRRQLGNKACRVDNQLQSENLQGHPKEKEKYIRVTSAIYYPYSVLIDIMPTSYGKCVKAGHLCYEPVKKKSKGNGTCSVEITWLARCCDGISISLLHLVSQKLNFNYDIYLTVDNKFGGKNHKGEWVGMIGDIINGRADFAANGFNPTPSRLEKVRFTSAYLNDYLSFVMRRSSLKEIPFVNWEFVRTMESDLALLVLISTLSVSIFIVVAENIGFVMRHHKYFSIREVMTYIFGLTFQRDMGGKNPLRWAARIAALSYAAAMMIVMTTYTAHLTAQNIQSETVSDFNGIKDEKVWYVMICYLD